MVNAALVNENKAARGRYLGWRGGISLAEAVGPTETHVKTAGAVDKMFHGKLRAFSQRCRVPNTIEEVAPEGNAVRARIGREAYDINVGQFCCGRLSFGYFHPDSPIIAYDSETAPTYSIDQFSQSTVPGCRTPHLWLRDGRSFYDVLGSDFTLLRFDPRVEIGGLVGAAAHRGVPMAVVDVDAADAGALYPCKLLLSRPDQHVAWRGDKPPADPMALIDRVRGASTRA